MFNIMIQDFERRIYVARICIEFRWIFYTINLAALGTGHFDTANMTEKLLKPT
jgi:hypothetical protein